MVHNIDTVFTHRIESLFHPSLHALADTSHDLATLAGFLTGHGVQKCTHVVEQCRYVREEFVRENLRVDASIPARRWDRRMPSVDVGKDDG